MSDACTCTISIENQRGKDTNYFILMDPNQFSGDGKPVMITWWSSSNSNVTTSEVPMGTGLYGFAKVVANDIRSGIPLMNGRGTSKPAGLGIRSDLSRAATGFHSPSLRINLPSDIDSHGGDCAVGFAATNSEGKIYPLATMAVGPNGCVNIIPTMRFDISERQGKAGEVVDYYDVGIEGTKIDFTRGPGKWKQRVHIFQKDDGRFDLSYS